MIGAVRTGSFLIRRKRGTLEKKLLTIGNTQKGICKRKTLLWRILRGKTAEKTDD